VTLLELRKRKTKKELTNVFSIISELLSDTFGDPPEGLSREEAVAAIEGVLGSIGDTCPECPPDT
jgi:hypothetical protein